MPMDRTSVRSLETPTSPDDCEIPTFSRTELGGANLSNIEPLQSGKSR